MDTSAIVKDSLMFPEKPFRLMGNRRFCCKARCSFLPTSVGLPITIIVLLYSLSQMIYFTLKYFTASNFLQIIFLSFHIVLFAILLGQIFIVSFSNPGVYFPKAEILSSDLRLKTMLATINGQDYFLKYCTTCNIVRDLRVFHCRTCNLCILRHDHHCPWLSVCIGYRNHKKFLLLLLITMIYLLFNILTTGIVIFNVKFVSDKDNMKLSTLDYILSIIYGILVLFVIGFVVSLIVYQTFFISTNQTTSENLRRQKGTKNPFTLESCRENQNEFWIAPLDYRKRIQYNENSSYFLEMAFLLIDYIDNIDIMYPNRRSLINKKEESKPVQKEENVSRETEMSITHSSELVTTQPEKKFVDEV